MQIYVIVVLHFLLLGFITPSPTVSFKSNAQVLQMEIDSKEVFQDDLIRAEVYTHASKEKPSAVTFAFAKQFQDNMVLQRAPKRARLYGFSPFIGARVMAQVSTTHDKLYYYSTSVVEGPAPGVGTWVITLDPMNTTEPVTIEVIAEEKRLTLKNVLFGDVWLCSGQSNMQFTVSQMLNGAEEAFDAKDYPNIRLFTVTETQSPTPLYDLAGVDENWTSPSSDKISDGAWKYFSAVCWLYGKHLYQTLGYPIGLVATDWGGTPVEAWSSPDALKACNVTQNAEPVVTKRKSNFRNGLGGPGANSCLWNAMVNPLLGMTIYGAIWYQGENDSQNPNMTNRYNCTFPTMIDDWRRKFHKASEGQTSSLFPFGFVQLSGYRAANMTSGFSEIRWHQTADYGYVPNPRMPNTFMAVTMDLPDFKSTYGDIHPRDKEDVGTRLSLAGLAVAYNKSGEFQGPFPVSGTFQPPSSVLLDYGHTWKLQILKKDGFEVSCGPSSPGETLIWQPVLIAASTPSSVILDVAVCGERLPGALRYAWKESPCPFKWCAIYSTVHSLPAPPFVFYFERSTGGKLTLKL